MRSPIELKSEYETQHEQRIFFDCDLDNLWIISQENSAKQRR